MVPYARNRQKYPAGKYQHQRWQRGYFLVDALVSILISGLIASALMQMYQQVHISGNSSQAQFSAALIANEIIDQLRAQSWSYIYPGQAGTHTPTVCGTLIVADDKLFPRALLQDSSLYVNNGAGTTGQVALDYTGNGNSYVVQGNSNVLHTVTVPGLSNPDNTVNVVLTNTINSGVAQVQVTISMSWNDTTGKTKTYTVSTMLTSFGING